MLNEKNIRLYAILIIAIGICSCKTQPLIIKPLSPYLYLTNNTIVEGKKIGSSKTKYFYIKNYKSNNKDQIKEIELFAQVQLEKDFEKFSQYDLYFFKYTILLNEKYIERDNDELAWHTKDQLFYFSWRKGKLFAFLEYENGEAKSKHIIDDTLINVK